MVKDDIYRRQEETDGQHDSRARPGTIRTSRVGVYAEWTQKGGTRMKEIR